MSQQAAATDISQTTLTWAQQASLLTSTFMRDLKNGDNQRIFDSAVADYNAGMASGVKMQLTPPVAPFKYVLTAPDVNGEVSYAQSTTERLTPTVPIFTGTANAQLTVTTPIVNHLSINWDTWRPGSKWVDANKDDGWPNTLETPPQKAPDGSMHTYERFSTPFGALYLQTS
jgi:hypothetical protein